MHSVVIEVPNDKVGLVIGKGGSTIKELESRTGGHVQVVDPPSKVLGRTPASAVSVCIVRSLTLCAVLGVWSVT